MLNCGYGSGFSVLDVIGSVKRAERFHRADGPASGGDPAAIVAKADRISKVLGWQPRLNDLDTIVDHALAWEKRLNRGSSAIRQPWLAAWHIAIMSLLRRA